MLGHQYESARSRVEAEIVQLAQTCYPAYFKSSSPVEQPERERCRSGVLCSLRLLASIATVHQWDELYQKQTITQVAPSGVVFVFGLRFQGCNKWTFNGHNRLYSGSLCVSAYPLGRRRANCPEVARIDSLIGMLLALRSSEGDFRDTANYHGGDDLSYDLAPLQPRTQPLPPPLQNALPTTIISYSYTYTRPYFCTGIQP
jgi:hypothetical protein